MSRPARTGPAALGLGGLVAMVAWTGRHRVPGGGARWARRNHRGRDVTLLEGVAWVTGAGAGIVVVGGSARLRSAALLGLLAGAAAGAVDDLCGSADARGLRGHLVALAQGRLTTGGLKTVGIGTAGLAAAALAGPAAARPAAGAIGTMRDGLLVATTANLVNLFDLRPGRALKVVLLLGLPAVVTGGPGAALAAAAAGPSLVLLPIDLREQGMLGDTGANAAGALLGVAAVAGLPPGVRWVALAATTALTLASERISFTRVIEATPPLRRLDRWGRTPGDDGVGERGRGEGGRGEGGRGEGGRGGGGAAPVDR